MYVSLYYLIDQCNVKTLALTSSSFEELCDRIQQILDEYCRTNGLSDGIRYVTRNPGVISYAKPEEILWVFLLLNPENGFGNHLDQRRKLLLDNALKLDPGEYTYGNSFDHVKVAKELQCSRMEGLYIVRYWEILPVFLDAERRKINLPYLIKMSTNVEDAEELYSIYSLCPMAEAESAVQEYLSNGAEKLSIMYPGGKLDIRGAEIVKRFDLGGNDGKAAWLKIKHPFFIANSSVPEHSAELFYTFLSHSIYRREVRFAYGYQDSHIEYKGDPTNGNESEEKIELIRREHYSYHDGGGGSSDVLRIMSLSEEKRKSLKVPENLMKKEYYSERKISIPPCEGYWEADGKLYLLNPFDMKNVFVWESYSRSWD